MFSIQTLSDFDNQKKCLNQNRNLWILSPWDFKTLLHCNSKQNIKRLSFWTFSPITHGGEKNLNSKSRDTVPLTWLPSVFLRTFYCLLVPMIALLNLYKDHMRISLIFHIHYSRIKTIRNSSIDIAIPEYPNLERGTQKRCWTREGWWQQWLEPLGPLEHWPISCTVQTR